MYCRGINKACQGNEGVLQLIYNWHPPTDELKRSGRTDEIRAVNLTGSQSDDDRGRLGERYLPDDGRPTRGRRPKPREKEEDPSPRSEEWSCGKPNSSDDHVGGKHERFLCRMALPGNHRKGSPSVALISSQGQTTWDFLELREAACPCYCFLYAFPCKKQSVSRLSKRWSNFTCFFDKGAGMCPVARLPAPE